MHEKVLVILKNKMMDFITHQNYNMNENLIKELIPGFYKENNIEKINDVVLLANLMDREQAENIDTVLQLIPYVILHNVFDQRELFIYNRSEKVGEKRLINRKSIGLGGHVNRKDFNNSVSLNHTILNNIGRELNEELVFIKGNAVFDSFLLIHDLQFKGFIYNNFNKVSACHLSLVFTAGVEKSCITIGEDELKEGEWFDFTKYEVNPDSDKMIDFSKFELWSQILIRRYQILCHI